MDLWDYGVLECLYTANILAPIMCQDIEDAHISKRDSCSSFPHETYIKNVDYKQITNTLRLTLFSILVEFWDTVS